MENPIQDLQKEFAKNTSRGKIHDVMAIGWGICTLGGLAVVGIEAYHRHPMLTAVAALIAIGCKQMAAINHADANINYTKNNEVIKAVEATYPAKPPQTIEVLAFR